MESIHLKNGLAAFVDDEDYRWLRGYTWSAVRNRRACYAMTHYRDQKGVRHSVSMHQLILRHHGRMEPGRVVDHINGDGLDNRKENLRVVSSAGNAQNRKKVGGTSRYKGVCWKRSRWNAQIKVGGQVLNLGFYVEEEDAARAYDRAAHRHFGVHARLNFPADQTGGVDRMVAG